VVKVFNNVLDNNHIKLMEEIMLDSKDFPWYFARHNLDYGHWQKSRSNKFLFTHNFFTKLNDPPYSNFFYLVEPIVDYIKKQCDNTESILRIKSNLYTNQHMNIETEPHIDQGEYGEKECLIGLFNVISCDGGTVIGGKTYPSVRNQLLLFDNVPHHGVTQSDTQARVCINFNFKITAEN